MSAIRIEAFEDPSRFKARVDAAVRELHSTPLAPGFDRVYAPGEKEFLCERDYREHGIPLTRQTLDDVLATARALDIEDTELLV